MTRKWVISIWILLFAIIFLIGFLIGYRYSTKFPKEVHETAVDVQSASHV